MEISQDGAMAQLSLGRRTTNKGVDTGGGVNARRRGLPMLMLL